MYGKQYSKSSKLAHANTNHRPGEHLFDVLGRILHPTLAEADTFFKLGAVVKKIELKNGPCK